MSDKYSLLNSCYYYIDQHNYDKVKKLLSDATKMHLCDVVNLLNIYDIASHKVELEELQFKNLYVFVQNCMSNEIIENYLKK